MEFPLVSRPPLRVMSTMRHHESHTVSLAYWIGSQQQQEERWHLLNRLVWVWTCHITERNKLGTSTGGNEYSHPAATQRVTKNEMHTHTHTHTHTLRGRICVNVLAQHHVRKFPIHRQIYICCLIVVMLTCCVGNDRPDTSEVAPSLRHEVSNGNNNR